jgi:hypothetical protein
MPKQDTLSLRPMGELIGATAIATDMLGIRPLLGGHAFLYHRLPH